MNKIVIDLKNYPSSEEIKRVCEWWSADFGTITFTKSNQIKINPCTFKNIIGEMKLSEFEKLRLIKDVVAQILKLVEDDPNESLCYTKNIQRILELELANTTLFDKFLNQIPADDFWSRRKLDEALESFEQSPNIP